MRRIAVLAAVSAVMAIAAPATAGKGDHYTAHLTELNDSGVVGQAVLRMGDGMLDVNMTVTSLDEGVTHIQHIHGKAEAEAECPTIARDTNSDGFIDVGEGAPDYGPVLLNLAPFPTPNNGGVTKTKATYTRVNSGESVASLAPLDSRVIVVHGLDINGNGVLDSGFEAAMPVACGEIMSQG